MMCLLFMLNICLMLGDIFLFIAVDDPGYLFLAVFSAFTAWACYCTIDEESV